MKWRGQWVSKLMQTDCARLCPKNSHELLSVKSVVVSLLHILNKLVLRVDRDCGIENVDHARIIVAWESEHMLKPWQIGKVRLKLL